MKATLALVDDHVLLRKGLANTLKEFEYQVLFEADNGKAFIEKLKTAQAPQLVLMDINMPQMDGYDTTAWLKKNHPQVKVLVLSMYDDENAIIRMLKNGARGYILKDSHPAELNTAISSILTKGFYHSELITGKMINLVNHLDDSEHAAIKEIYKLNDREIEFIKLCCTELTYKEIADEMNLSPRTVDGYRDQVFKNLEVKSRIGLVIFAIKHGLVKV